MIGIPVFKGIGIGQALNYSLQKIDIPEHTLEEHMIENEQKRLTEVIAKREKQLQEQVDIVEETVGIEESQILVAHIEILNDPELIDRINENISKRMNLMKSVEEARNFYVGMFMKIDDEYIRERAKDIEDVMNSILRTALGFTDNPLATLTGDTIIFAKDLTPSDTVLLTTKVKGIVLEDGSLTSHTAIVAKAKGITTLVGYSEERPKDGELVILDTDEVKLWINPTQETQNEYAKRLAAIIAHREKLRELKDVEAVTKDNMKVQLFGNVGSVEDAASVSENGGFGVGLLRTELIYMDSKDWPTTEEQFKIYTKICDKIEGSVIIRTLDIGGDKTLPYYTFQHEENPFLGLRAVRFCLKNEEIFKTQLRAILKTSATKDVRVMFPMIGAEEEVIASKKILEAVKDELRSEGVSFNEDIPVGIMVEIPSAVFAMDRLAKHVDFVSVGTNDLCQYTLAVDRLNSSVADLYNPMNVSILRMIQHVVAECHKLDVEVGVCGEMAGDLEAARVLIGLGVDELSVTPIMIPYIKEMILQSDYKALVAEALRITE